MFWFDKKGARVHTLGVVEDKDAVQIAESKHQTLWPKFGMSHPLSDALERTDSV